MKFSFDNLETIKAIKNQNGLLSTMDKKVANAISAAGATLEDLETEAKTAAVGVLIQNTSETCSSLLSLIGLDIDPSIIESAGEVLIIGAGVSAANKTLDKFQEINKEENTIEDLSKKEDDKEETLKAFLNKDKLSDEDKAKLLKLLSE